MTSGEYLKEDIKTKSEKREAKKTLSNIKGQKILPIASKIGEHDLQTKINGICKWLNKCYEVKIIITGESSQNVFLILF